MRIWMNGEERPLGPGTTVAGLLAGRDPRGLAVAVNGEVVPREAHASHELAEGDVVDVVEAVQGG